MTLAVLFLIALFSGMPAPVAEAGPQQSPSPTASSETHGQDQDQTKPTTLGQQPSIKESKTQPSPKPKSSAKKTRKKKTTNSDCNSSKSKPADATSNSSTSSAKAASTHAAPAVTPTNCPPPKIVVREGGTTDPSIQLAGGPTADEAARKRDAINQLLETTEQNLKKASEKQLTSTEQDTVSQTRQFVDESKQAMADGDLERARNLAWKAELLSGDLVNPQK